MRVAPVRHVVNNRSGPRLPSSSGARAVRRLVFLSSCPEPWGGSEELWWQAACNLRDAGHTVDVLKTVVDPGHPRIRALRERGCRVRDLAAPTSLAAWGTGTLLLLGRRRPTELHHQLVLAFAALTRHRPDLAVISQGQNFDGLFLARLCQRLRIPYVIVSQKASELTWPTDAIRDYGRRVFAGARRCVFVADHNRRLTEDQFGTGLDNAVMLRNPLLVPLSPLPWPPGETLRLACVARLYLAEKGQDLLLHALADARWRARDLRVSLIGHGPNEASLRDLSARLELTSVRFTGHVSDVADVWRTHHALVLPSRAEGLPLALMEAMACGRPSIVTDVGGTAELVREGVNGFVAPEASRTAMSDALERAWQRRADWPGLGLAAAADIGALAPERGSGALADILLDESGVRPR